jgi:hypothetical protein
MLFGLPLLAVQGFAANPSVATLPIEAAPIFPFLAMLVGFSLALFASTVHASTKGRRLRDDPQCL